jgi:hypothetical protein
MMRGMGLKFEAVPVRLSKFVLISLKDSEHRIKAKYIFFFSFMTRLGEASRSLERSKNHTRSVVYEKTEHNLLKIPS